MPSKLLDLIAKHGPAVKAGLSKAARDPMMQPPPDQGLPAAAPSIQSAPPVQHPYMDMEPYLPPSMTGEMRLHAAQGLAEAHMLPESRLGPPDKKGKSKTVKVPNLKDKLIENYGGFGNVNGQFAPFSIATGYEPNPEVAVRGQGPIENDAWNVAKTIDPSVDRKAYTAARREWSAKEKARKEALKQRAGLSPEEQEALDAENGFDVEADEEGSGGPQPPAAVNWARFHIANAEFKKADRVFDLHPHPADSVESWKAWATHVFGANVVPAPPLEFIRYTQDPEGAGRELGSRMTPSMLAGADHGLGLAAQIGQLYKLQRAEVDAVDSDGLGQFNDAARQMMAGLGRTLPAQAPVVSPEELAARKHELSRQHAKELTGKLFAWGILSRSKSPYPHEAAYIDMAGHETGQPGQIDPVHAEHVSPDTEGQEAADEENRQHLEYFIGKTIDGTFDPKEYQDWASTIYAGRVSPGVGATENINAFGSIFLKAMNEKGEDGLTHLHWLHEQIRDQDSGAAVRRAYAARVKGTGIDNKVLSFIMLLTGKTDCLVLDRIQINHAWGGEKYWQGLNLYEKGKALRGTTGGVRGALVYEALERSLQKPTETGETVLQRMYKSMGVEPEKATPAHFHWLSWNIHGEMEVDHDSIGSIARDAEHGQAVRAGAQEPIGRQERLRDVGVREGRLENLNYGARYGLHDVGGEAPQHSVLYTVPGTDETYWFDPSVWKDVVGRITKPGADDPRTVTDPKKFTFEFGERMKQIQRDPVIDPETGQPQLNAKGKPVMKTSKVAYPLAKDEQGNLTPWHAQEGIDAAAFAQLVRNAAAAAAESGLAGRYSGPVVRKAIDLYVADLGPAARRRLRDFFAGRG